MCVHMHISDGGLLFRLYKELKNKKQNNPFKNWAWYWNKILKKKKKIKKWLRNIFF